MVNEHPVQFGGICLGGTGCGGDPYYGDRAMLEFLSIAFDPTTGAARVIYTDSSQAEINANFDASNTVIPVARQTSGPSAYANKAAVADAGAYGSSINDPSGDAGFPTNDIVPMTAAPGADITKVALSLPERRPHAARNDPPDRRGGAGCGDGCGPGQAAVHRRPLRDARRRLLARLGTAARPRR